MQILWEGLLILMFWIFQQYHLLFIPISIYMLGATGLTAGFIIAGVVLSVRGLRKFREGFDYESEKRNKEIKKLDKLLEKEFEEIRYTTNSEKRYRIREVIKDRNDILDAFFKDKNSLLKQRIALQSLELISAYLKVLNNYYIRLKELGTIEHRQIAGRIQKTEDKVISIKDENAAQELLNSLEIDRKVYSKYLQEKEELEGLNAKLNYIESSINSFKQQIHSNLENEQLSEEVQKVINESVALDNVLTQRKNERYKI